MSFVGNFIRFPAVQKFWKSAKSWQSYREFKGGNFFETQCISTYFARRSLDSNKRALPDTASFYNRLPNVWRLISTTPLLFSCTVEKSDETSKERGRASVISLCRAVVTELQLWTRRELWGWSVVWSERWCWTTPSCGVESHLFEHFQMLIYLFHCHCCISANAYKLFWPVHSHDIL